MTSGNRISGDDVKNAIADAVLRREPVTVTHRGEDGWHGYKSRLLSALPEGRTVVVEPFVSPTGKQPPAPGEIVEVAVRAGNRKLVFSATRCAPPLEADPRFEYLTWPQRIQRLNRRAFQRAEVPAGRIIPVRMWCVAKADEMTPEDRSVIHGELVDISLGGACVDIPDQCRIARDATYRCVMVPSEGTEPLVVEARPRHSGAARPGRRTVGLHFFGIESTPDADTVVQQISHIIADFQAAARRSANRSHK